MKSSFACEVFYFVLQFFWMLRLVYEHYVLGIKRTENDDYKKSQSNILLNYTSKRHIIKLFMGKDTTGKCQYQMKIQQMITPQEEELLRCACAKGQPSNDDDYQREDALPRKQLGYIC